MAAEKLDVNGHIDQVAQNGNNINMSCTYILAGVPDGERWKQQFSYDGARHVPVKLQAEKGSKIMLQIRARKGHFIVSDSPVIVTFSCDDERLNRIYRLITEAIDSNLKSVDVNRLPLKLPLVKTGIIIVKKWFCYWHKKTPFR